MIVWDSPTTLNESGDENVRRTRAWLCYLVGFPFVLLLMLAGSLVYVRCFDYPPAPAPGQGTSAAEAVMAAQRTQKEAGR